VEFCLLAITKNKNFNNGCNACGILLRKDLHTTEEDYPKALQHLGSKPAVKTFCIANYIQIVTNS